MARGDEIDTGFEVGRLNCAVCGDGRIDVGNDGYGTCRNCHESFSFSFFEEFVLVETNGWVVRVSVGDRAAESVDAVNV